MVVQSLGKSNHFWKPVVRVELTSHGGCLETDPLRAIALRLPQSIRKRRHADWRVEHSTVAVCMLLLAVEGQRNCGNNGSRRQYRSVPAAARPCVRRRSDCSSVIAPNTVEAVNLLRNGNGCTVVWAHIRQTRSAVIVFWLVSQHFYLRASSSLSSAQKVLAAAVERRQMW
ncbi:hypothetical protein BU25DRAFT_413195 [Macroventuria anomochaeta]|uniref:Uncharacterized protein n=1 Tax=Macroventuria anomochaeta TaxID=301207 RepID=A0ACB6RS72_9PLEO|nr:uncharacterized protein BU25DRAFT_413195 [Macroventuria anomochaeta]KAF2624648.1 hypothetical protein BU25DRAFT_413195 [Macroventuria anomochaeta]